MAGPRECDEQNTWLTARVRQLDDDLGKCHALRFPRRNREGQADRELSPLHGRSFFVVNGTWEDRSPGPLMGH